MWSTGRASRHRVLASRDILAAFAFAPPPTSGRTRSHRTSVYRKDMSRGRTIRHRRSELGSPHGRRPTAPGTTNDPAALLSRHLYRILLILIPGFALWVAYGIASADMALVIPNVVAFVVATTTVICAFQLRARIVT